MTIIVLLISSVFGTVATLPNLIKIGKFIKKIFYKLMNFEKLSS